MNRLRVASESSESLSCPDRSFHQCHIRLIKKASVAIFIGKPIPRQDRFLSRDRWSPTICDRIVRQRVISGLGICIVQADGETIGRRIHINRPDDESARCKDLRVSDLPKDFSQAMQPHTIRSTSSAI